MSRTFADSTGQPWELEVTVKTLRRVRSLAGVDLIDTVFGKEDGPPDLLSLVDCLCAVLRPALEEKGVSDEQFAERIGGDALEGAMDALMGAVADFFPSARRAVLLEQMEKAKEHQARMATMIGPAMDREMRRTEELLERGPRTGASSLPASSASIPESGRSGT